MRRLLALLLLATLVRPALAGDPAPTTLVLAARSIGSRRGDPPERRAHAALLVTFPGRPGGVIVQGGKEKVHGFFRDGARVVGYVIPCADPAIEFTRAYGAFWGEASVRDLPTTVLARFSVPGLDEERIRAMVAALNDDLAPREYRLEAGPSSNSFVSLFLDALKLPLPPVGGAELPGWGWRP
ncbi:MAG TPA: hypothetical protein VF841_22010 [Anaeromyxobacter sp.]